MSIKCKLRRIRFKVHGKMVLLWPFLAESMVPWSCVWEQKGSGEKKTPGGQVQDGTSVRCRIK